MNVLVTGGAGVIGRFLVERLARDPDNWVVSVDRRTSVPKPRVLAVQCDLRNFEFGLNHYDVIYHLAGSFERTKESEEYTQTCIDDNIEATSHLARQILEMPVKPQFVVFASSYLVYDSELYMRSPRSSPERLYESSRLDPRNLCGAAKLLGERLLSQLPVANVISARIFRVYGGGGNEVISRWIRGAICGSEIKLHDGSGAFDYIHAEDVADGLMALVNHTHGHLAVNLGTGVSTEVGDVARYIVKRIPGTPFMDSGDYDRVERSVAVMERMRSICDWRTIELHDGIDRTIREEL